MKKYCAYYKKSIINYYKKCSSIKKVLNAYNICRKTLFNWNKAFNNGTLYNKIKYKSHASIKYKLEIMEYIKKYIINKDNFRMTNLLKLIKQKFNCVFNKNNIYYSLKKLGITYKKAHKNIIINKRKHKKDVKNLKNTISKIGYDKIISTDECHFQTNMKPNKGWNKKGERVTFIKNTGNRINVSLICSVTNKKVIHYEIHKTSVNRDVFINYIKKVNKKGNRKHILLDNARIHHAKDLIKYMNNKTNKLLYNIPYNPETNPKKSLISKVTNFNLLPIEQMFNKIKSFVKKENTSTYKNLVKAIDKSIKTITADNLNYYFSNSFKK